MRKSYIEEVLSCKRIEFQVRNVLIIRNIASHQRQIVFRSNGSIDKIKGTGFDPLLLVFQLLPQDSAPFGNRQ